MRVLRVGIGSIYKGESFRCDLPFPANREMLSQICKFNFIIQANSSNIRLEVNIRHQSSAWSNIILFYNCIRPQGIGNRKCNIKGALLRINDISRIHLIWSGWGSTFKGPFIKCWRTKWQRYEIHMMSCWDQGVIRFKISNWFRHMNVRFP